MRSAAARSCSIAAAGVLLASTPAHAQEWSVASPDGRTTVAVVRSDAGRLSWRVAHAGKPILLESPLGVRRADQAFVEDLRFISATSPSPIDDRYQMPHGKRRDHRALGRQRTLAFANAAGSPIEIVLRADDDGVAFRYRFPADGDRGARGGASRSGAGPLRATVVEELTGFGVPPNATGWMLPQSPPGRYTPAYEDYFGQVTAGQSAPTPSGWDFPALFTTGGAWLLITEAGLDGEYSGSRLASDARNGLYRIRLPEAGEGRGVGSVEPTSTLPWTLPWRVVVVGETAGAIVESDLVLDLSPPSRVSDTSWIVPGRASWSWWSESDSPKHASALNRFVDLAADMTWEYSLVDANWNVMETGTIDDVVAHAKAKGVGLLFWYNSGGPHNDVTEAPRDRMHTREARRAEFAKLQAMGVKGVKVDFWQSDKQDRIRQYRDLLEDAADFHLLANFHGSTVPRGWSREFPHLIGMEGVFGAEQYKFRDHYPARAASHNTILPFTRNAVGPMDFTPVTFSDAKYPHLTTSAHELALSVVFENGVQHFADSDKAYRALPDAPRNFLAQVPAAWEDTKVLVGDPGRMVVVARRRGDSWWIGGINGRDTAQTIALDLSRVGPGPWTATIIRDGDQDRTFAADTRIVAVREPLTIVMRGRGGFAIRLTPPGTVR